MGFRVQGLRFAVCGLGFGVSGSAGQAFGAAIAAEKLAVGMKADTGSEQEVDDRRTATSRLAANGATCGTEPGSYLRLVDSRITQLKAQGASRTCDESKQEEETTCEAGSLSSLCVSLNLRLTGRLRTCVESDKEDKGRSTATSKIGSVGSRGRVG